MCAHVVLFQRCQDDSNSSSLMGNDSDGDAMDTSCRCQPSADSQLSPGTNPIH
ncbi:GD19944 [Drosophila simulans]|uniref:GD19944 n=1 Tax=Drosophila simulans TaxID=7240 RepID=B4QZQ1_DROSI|nr:GD19944 [Drosophila simulans]